MRTTPLLVAGIGLLLLAGCGEPGTTRLRDSADYARWQGRWVDAADDYAQITRLHPGDWRAQYRLGQCMLALGQPQQARASLEVAETLRPGDSEIADLLAEAYLEDGDTNHLFSWLRLRAERTQTTVAWMRLAEYAMELDDPDSAMLAADTAIAIDEGRTVEPLLLHADLAVQLGDERAAVDSLRWAWRINPDDTRVNTALRDLGQVPGPTMPGLAGATE